MRQSNKRGSVRNDEISKMKYYFSESSKKQTFYLSCIQDQHFFNIPFLFDYSEEAKVMSINTTHTFIQHYSWKVANTNKVQEKQKLRFPITLNFGQMPEHLSGNFSGS